MSKLKLLKTWAISTERCVSPCQDLHNGGQYLRDGMLTYDTLEAVQFFLPSAARCARAPVCARFKYGRARSSLQDFSLQWSYRLHFTQ